MRRSRGTAPGIGRRRNHFERRLQIFIVRQFRRLVDPQYASLIAMENGEGRAAETLDLLHAMGVEDGVPDLVLLGRCKLIRWIEIKLEATLHHAATGINDAQLEMHATLRYYGFKVDVVRTWDEFWAIVDEEGIPHRPPPTRREQLLLWEVHGRR